MKSRFFLSFLFVFCIFAFSASAQIPVSTGGLELSVSSNNPVPGQKITLTVRSYAIDINSAKISWKINGKQDINTVGATTLEVTAPALGKKLTIEVTATTPEGRVVAASTIIGSGSVDLIFETDGYTPPFFRGKVAPVYQNTVKITAVPHIANSAGVEYDPKTLVYEWKRNSRAIENQSGYGKQSITVVGDVVPRPYDISVSVWPRDESGSAQAYTTVGMANPYIAFYVDDPTYGTLFNSAVKNVIRIGSQKEVAVLASPFGFNGAGDENELSWSWSINNLRRAELSANRSVLLRAPDDSSGSSIVQLNIKNADKILQGITAGFSAQFSNKSDAASGDITF